MSGPVLSVRDLVKHFRVRGGGVFSGGRPVKAVDGISFDLAEGKTLGLVGESGCGKSTTARMLLRLEDPSSGRVLFRGEEVQNRRGRALASFRREVQAVFQDPYSALSPRMRVRDFIAEPMLVAGGRSRSERRQRVKELCRLVGLPARAADSFPHEFSGGQRQRISIARALAPDPRLLILDEPVSALDVSIQAQVLNLLRDLQARFGLSYVLISHDLDVVGYMCDEIAVMNAGKIVEVGSRHSIFSAPQRDYTRSLLAARLPRHPSDRRSA